MASNPTLATGHHQYATTSPLDQIVNGNHAVPPRHALLDRAMTLTRKTQVKPREYEEEINRSGMSNNVLADGSNHFGYAMGGEDNEIHQQQSTGSSRQRVQDLRAARLSQQQTVQSNPSSSTLQPNHSRPSHASTLISNAFRDSVASDMSFNSISGPDERYSMVGGYDAVNGGTTEDDPGRIAEAVRGLALRRRQSIDTVRSSEFGEGGKWDRAWGGSDEEDEEEDYMLNQNFALSNIDIEGRAAQSRGGALDQINQGQWSGREEEQKRRTITANDRNPAQFPSLHDASGVEHVVSLMTSLQRPKQTLGIGSTSGESAVQKEAGPHAHIQRRDTLMSMVGDVGESSSSSSRAGQHQYRDSNATVGASNVERPLSFASDSSRSNAHVYVWPPTPAASEHGSSNEGGNDGQYSKRDTLLAYPAGVGIGQRAMVEYADTPASLDVTTSYPSPIEPMSPSAALARPLDSPILEPDGTASSRREKAAARASYGSGSGHPTGRLPPQPPGTTTTSMKEERYADPNQPLYSPMYGELGRMRKKAIEEQGGRESLVSDLDVETLRLDGGSEDWGSRRGSTSSLGSFSSDKIRDQRQRRSQASIMSTYSDKRSSSGTIQEQSRQVQARDMSQHHSWNGATRRGESQPGPQVETIGSSKREIGPPKRSNTGPDSYQTPIQQHQPASLLTGNSPALQQSMKSISTMTKPNGSSLTFMTPQPDRESKKQTNVTVAVKGAMNNSQAERFLTLAITHHESGDLSRSAYYFERSAKVEGGCVVGMCMWGMALREGWGVRKDQLKGFDWISRAAARAGEMMAGSQGSGKGVMNKGDAELKAIRSELKLSVYELGKCFCYGWGVKMDKPMALEYFELAAKLGDSDAQAEAGALLAAGKGCKKDLKKAAMYYRMAEAQGYDTVGLSWIHKDKYDPSPVANTKYK